jgi:hypothetical protein
MRIEQYQRTLISREERAQIIKAYGKWVRTWVKKGWDAYLVTFMFHDLSGSKEARISQMHQEISRVYSRLATRMVRKPRSPAWAHLLPKAIFAPDLPVPKKSKISLRDASTNEGLHMHGIVIANRWGRLTSCLDVQFSNERDRYCIGKIRTIDAERIVQRPRYTAEYALKGMKRTCFDLDHMLILPRTVGESTLAVQSDLLDREIKDIQAAWNVSEELAQKIRENFLLRG